MSCKYERTITNTLTTYITTGKNIRMIHVCDVSIFINYLYHLVVSVRILGNGFQLENVCILI